MKVPNVNGREVVTIRQAMGICGVSRRTINNWMTKQRVERTHTAGGGVRIYADSLWRHQPKGAGQ